MKTAISTPDDVFEQDKSQLLKDQVVNIFTIATIDRRRMSDKVNILPQGTMAEIDYGLELVLNSQ